MNHKMWIGAAFGVLAAGVAAAGDLAVSAYWQDHMVLQRGKPITVWGRDVAGRGVTVAFAGQEAKTVTGADGIWETTFAQPFALSAAPQMLTISDGAGESIELRDVLVGDVFLAAGQSNMDRTLSYKVSFQEPQGIKDFCRDDDGIRFIRIARSAENDRTGEEQLFDLPSIKTVNDAIKYYGDGHDWAAAKGDDRNYVSSVALNFARYIRDANAEKGLDIPIGIIHASSGGTAIRQWLSTDVLKENGYALETSDGWYWNSMMAPILRAKFRAVLWYQGCSDAMMQPDEYKGLMDVLVKDRRERWGENGDLPFYAVQIGTPGYGPSNGTVGLDQYPAPTENLIGSNYVRVREGQRLWDVSETGKHGLVPIVDCVRCMDSSDLHPTDKNFVGRRLSLFARRDIYGETDLQAEGPAYTRAVREPNGKVRIFFRSGTALGLTAGRMKPASDIAVSHWVKSKDPIRGFAMCGSDNVWKDAVATVEGETVVLRAEGVASPTRFHYGYWCITRSSEQEDGQRLNLYNEAGLPMSPVAPQAVEDPNASAQVSDPVFVPASCTFSPTTNVTITCATTGATIRYTIDGSEPTELSKAYEGPVAISATTTVKARAYKAGKEASDIVFATYTLGETEVEIEPDPQWTTGAYEPSAWKPLGENLLANARAEYTGSLSYICSKDMSKLSDGKIQVTVTGDTGAGSQKEVVGFCDGSAAIWTFDAPVDIGRIRLSTRWINTSYDGITVQDVYVLKGTDWIALNTPISHKSGVATITTGALEATLADEGLGYLAQNVSGLKIVFGKPESAVANYYAEIEALAPGGVVPHEPPDDPEDPPDNPDDPPDDPDDPPAEPGLKWTTGDYDPSKWAGLDDNTLVGLTAQEISNPSKLSFAASKDLSKLTDGAVSASAASTEIVGLQENAELAWTFDEPMTVKKIRFSSLWSSKIYAGINIADILVQTRGSSAWTSLGASVSRSGNATAAGAQYALLEDPGTGYLALDVMALKVVFGKAEAFANYYAEIEAVGEKSSEAPTAPPVLGAVKVVPWGDSAEFRGSLVSVGTGASKCDVTLAYGADAEHLGEPVVIYSGNIGAFAYELGGLELNTAYCYRLAASNDAETVVGCVAEGTFTTTGEVHPDWSDVKWAVIGDSLTDPTLPPGEGNYYYDFVARDTGIQLAYVNGVGSTGYKNKQDANKCFYQRLEANPLPNDVDVVTIFGSVNDWGQVRSEADAGSPSDRLEDGKTTLAAYINKAIDVIEQQASNARIALVGSIYYYNVVEAAHVRANETLRAVAAARGVAFYDWLTENPDDPLDFHHIADNPTAEGSFAQRYARDCPKTIIPGETQFGHPSAEYHEVWLSPHFRGVLTETLASAKAIRLGEATARPSTDYNGSAVSVAFADEIPEGAAVSAKVTIDGKDYVGTVGESVVTFAVPSDAVTAGNVYAGTITVTVDGTDFTKPVTLEQGTIRVDENVAWIAESAETFGATGAWAGDVAEVVGGVIAVSNAFFTAAEPSPANAVVTVASTFAFKGTSEEEFNPAAQAGVKVVKVGSVNRYAFLTGEGVVTNLDVVADVSAEVCVAVTLDKVERTVKYAIGDMTFGPFSGVAEKGAVTKVRYAGATEVASLDGEYRAERLDANLAQAGGVEYATVAEALAAGTSPVRLLWDATWEPSAAGDFAIAKDGYNLVIGGDLAYSVKDNGDGTVTVTVVGGEQPEAPKPASITLSGTTVKVGVEGANENYWYALLKTTNLADIVNQDNVEKLRKDLPKDAWVQGSEILELEMALAPEDKSAFYRVVVSTTAPAQKGEE